VRKLILLFVLLFTSASHAAAQSTPKQIRAGDSLVVADTIPKEDHTARNAFIRAMIIPGWGHYSIGAYKRGTVFVALEGTSWFMLTKTLVKLNRAKDHENLARNFAKDSIRALMAEDTTLARQLADPVKFDDAVGADPDVVATASLVSARTNQRQDWITYTLFFTMASAVDAYVAANLRDFPVGVSALPRPDGAVAIGFTVQAGRRRK
jgi:hypothetical protein